MKRTFTAKKKVLVFDLWKRGTGFSEIARILGSRPDTIFYHVEGYGRHQTERTLSSSGSPDVFWGEMRKIDPININEY